jgi:hypothetical protein
MCNIGEDVRIGKPPGVLHNPPPRIDGFMNDSSIDTFSYNFLDLWKIIAALFLYHKDLAWMACVPLNIWVKGHSVMG